MGVRIELDRSNARAAQHPSTKTHQRRPVALLSRPLGADSPVGDHVGMIAEPGAKGEGGNRTGAEGKDEILEVPLGTIARDFNTGEVLFEITKQDEEKIGRNKRPSPVARQA